MSEERRVRDMSESAFRGECVKRGFKGPALLGYYDVGHGVRVSVLNAGPRRRDQLAYLIAAAARVERVHGKEAV